MEATTLTAAAAASIAVVHTLAGPDHYVPFIALARAHHWSHRKLALITALCGLGHVGSSILFGVLAALLGLAVTSMDAIQGQAGALAGWGLVIMGGLYALWGAWKAVQGHSHSHLHLHADGDLHRHGHHHPALSTAGTEHLKVSHNHGGGVGASSPRHKVLTPWVLFLIFAFGPCEPLIAFSFPLGLSGDWLQLAWITGVFSVVTIITMLVVVFVAHFGLLRLQFPLLERLVHLLAGVAIFLSGAGILWLGL